MNLVYSRFATVDDVRSPAFASINTVLDRLTAQYDLPDHSDLNKERYPWSVGMVGTPALYAARLWEYPFAIQAGELARGMQVADLGCGMTAFTLYLRDHAGCNVVGVDPDVFASGLKYRGHGVSQEFLNRTGLTVIQGDLTAIPLASDSQDCIFCISVMEHVPDEVKFKGMQEIARVLKPGGRAVITVDISMHFFLNRPLDLVWYSGLNLLSPIDLRWPVRRFGLFSDSGLPADVFGFTLLKDAHRVDTQYRHDQETVGSLHGYRVPTLIPLPSKRPLWRRAAGLVYRNVRNLLHATKHCLGAPRLWVGRPRATGARQ
jgi:SAM-dependent methyltransferase